MFNDLNNQNSKPGGAVDDIFAETDNSPSQSEIETRKVGLASAGGTTAMPHFENNVQTPTSTNDEMAKQILGDDQEPPRPANRGYLKVVIIVLIVLALGAAAYFAYLNLFSKGDSEVTTPEPIVNNAPVTPPVNNFVEVIPEEIANVMDEEPALEEASSSSSTLPNTMGTSTEAIENDFQNFVDSDGDGLSDEEEVVLETNPNIIDSDNDGLSDYEEARIYLSNPLNTDTDGDGYPDGEEVRAGYDPNAVGAKLPGNNR